MAGYYPDWSGDYLSPENVDWSKFDVMDFAFALPTSDGNLEFTQDDSSDLLKRLVSTGHAAGKRVKLSIGGWTGSAYFSTICGSKSLRKTFVSNILTAYNSYNLDGIDIDWEYPGTGGASGNAVSSSDSAHFLTFLKDLRAALPSGAIITTATQVWPFADSNGNPMADVSGFAAVIDWILIMNYDIWGSSSTPGPNAPLSDACGNSTQPLANAYAAVSSWTSAGMPANQITLGVPAYGYLQKSSADHLIQRRGLHPASRHSTSPSSNKTDTRRRRSDITLYNTDGGTTDGQVMFEDLIQQGVLVSDSSTGSYIGAGGFVREWDSCSSTPWLKSKHSDQIVTYDDPQSMSLKGQFAAQAGLRGCNVFSVDGDYINGAWPLTDAVRSGLGL
ncbi:glycoside hydrolase superfamily [Naematelia encephala]|uniref:Glycoside hydrolase superfamily n=1 Tax=Naematelia encephala TaxID=71784 RepID=A0A1Y2BF35_9TREE|nr:glycoside hydrolase superfamily [Naematelia encephala]